MDVDYPSPISAGVVSFLEVILNLEQAVRIGFGALATEGYGNVGEADAKNKVFDVILNNEMYKKIVVAMVAAGVSELSATIEATIPKEQLEDWENADHSKKAAMVEKISAASTRESLSQALDLIWLGIVIGSGINAAMMQDPHVKDTVKMIDGIMEESKAGPGNCGLCYLPAQQRMKWGPNGEPICPKCSEKHPEGVTNFVNARLKAKFGDNAPIAVKAETHVGTDDSNSDSFSIFKPKKDITKFN